MLDMIESFRRVTVIAIFKNISNNKNLQNSWLLLNTTIDESSDLVDSCFLFCFLLWKWITIPVIIIVLFKVHYSRDQKSHNIKCQIIKQQQFRIGLFNSETSTNKNLQSRYFTDKTIHNQDRQINKNIISDRYTIHHKTT